MVLRDEEHQHAQEILKAMNEAIEQGKWERSLFFKTIRKQLEMLRQHFQDNLAQLQVQDKLAKKTLGHFASPGLGLENDSEKIEVYVSLYLTEGANLKKWENFLTALGRVHSVSRPVYQEEANIIDLIKTKDFKQNDAYIVISVPKSAVQKPYNDRPPVDRAGRKLLVLKQGAIRPENIKRFVHSSGVYTWSLGKLLRKDNADFLK